MQNDRSITIYTARSRKEKTLRATPILLSELFERLSQSQALPYTLEAYKGLKKPQQDDLKDVGGYIAGTLKNGRRKSGAVLTRCAAVLDADNLPAGATEDFIRRVAAFGCCYAVHSTAKHSPATPRLRAIIPFSDDIPADQYAPVVRLLCQMIQPEMTWFDPTCAEAGRIMYLPAHCQDVAPVWSFSAAGLLDARALLAQFEDWRNVAQWPSFPRETPAERAAKQQDPTEKKGVVGAFCRVYDVPAAMAQFLPGVYEETSTEGRYTFTRGSTCGGAVVYEGGKFLFSHHATDPAGGKLVNAFDLVRLHLFGDLDDEAKDGTPPGRLPSYTAMVERARNDTAVGNELAKETFQAAFADDETADEDAGLALARYSGEFLSLQVTRLALRAMGIQARRNLITGRAEISGMPPEYSRENAANVLPVLLVDKLRAVGVKGASKAAITDYLAVLIDENRYNPVLEMLDGTEWDGTTRLPELLRILGISPDSLEAALVRKWLVQCVALANNGQGRREAAEGVLTLQGGQGIGKTLFFRRLSVNSEWFAEGVTLDLKNKDHVMTATGAWITELGELDSTLRRDQSSLKAFLTSTEDRIRAPYAREAAFTPRHASFCATVNPDTFLRDETGDRRFWVVPVDHIALHTLLALPTEWFIQLWAEVYGWWQESPQSYHLTPDERLTLDRSNSRYREALPGEEEIRQALNFDLPADQWGEFSSTQLRDTLYSLRNNGVSVRQVGRALSKLVREDKRLGSRLLNGIKRYRLPIQDFNASTLPAPNVH